MISSSHIVGHDRLRRLVAAAALLIASNVPVWATAQSTGDLSGRVFNVASRAGIENLEVKLTPPRSVNVPIRLTRTDRNGDFLFRRVAPGRYMIEVSQGLHILYRVEIDSTRQSRLDIPLQRQR
jgi:hypothetical protein